MIAGSEPLASEALYCEIHDGHWIPPKYATAKGGSCPWCQRDAYWDKLEDIEEALEIISHDSSLLNEKRNDLRKFLGKEFRRGS